MGIIIVRIAGRAASRGVTHSAHAARMTYCGLGSTFNNAPISRLWAGFSAAGETLVSITRVAWSLYCRVQVVAEYAHEDSSLSEQSRMPPNYNRTAG